MTKYYDVRRFLTPEEIKQLEVADSEEFEKLMQVAKDRQVGRFLDMWLEIKGRDWE